MSEELKIGDPVEFVKDGVELEGKITVIADKITVETRFGTFFLKLEEVKKVKP